MKTKKITRETIVNEAVAYINETGNSSISLHELARRLGIKAPSLYNHIKNIKELQYEIFQYAIEQFVSQQTHAVNGKTKDDAIRAFADSYYEFAVRNKGLYHLIMSMPLKNDSKEKQMAIPLLEIVVGILSDYGLDRTAIAHWQRIFRAILHGFITQEELGYFYYYENISLKDSRDMAIECFINGLHMEINRRNNEKHE